MNTLRKYAMGLGGNMPIQQAVDYGSAALVGAGAQQLNNMVLGGSDPNPLLSGALFSPLGTAVLRAGRGSTPSGFARNMDLNLSTFQNPYGAAAYNASLAGAVTGAGTSLYNTIVGGADVDNNMVTIPAALLAGAFPLASRMIKGNPSINRGGVFGVPSDKTYDYHSVPREGYVREPNPDNRYRG
tara:strand:- start:7680 stop:8234 length:555 start_codon:yes stop_codon:yes gene_type:complete